MSTTNVSSFYEMDHMLYAQNQRNNQLRSQFSTERKIVGSSVNITRNNRNLPSLTVGSTTSAFVPVATNRQTVITNQTVPAATDNNMGVFDHRKLEPQQSLASIMSEQERYNQTVLQRNNINTSRYKTELCRPFEESGDCKYKDKCQFAHGMHELRNLARHPKYKTEPCRTFHASGFCPYGPRCHFIHSEDPKKLNNIVNKNQQAHISSIQMSTQIKTIQNQIPHFATGAVQNHQQQVNMRNPSPPVIQLEIKYRSVGSMGSSMESSPPSSVTDSPTSLSPTCWTEELQHQQYNPALGRSSIPSPTQSSNSSASSSPVFNYNCSANLDLAPGSSMVTPLNVQTQQVNNVVNNNVNLLAQQFQVMSFNNNVNHHQIQFSSMGDNYDFHIHRPSPPSPPDSISSDSSGHGSTSSISSGSHLTNTCSSPLEIGKNNLRLPIFNQLSQDGC